MENGFAQTYFIQDTKIGKGTFANSDFEIDQVIGVLEGEVLPFPTRYTVQVGASEHIVPQFGKYMNHSCQPNCYLNLGDRTFRALRSIMKGQELYFDYNSTEFELAEPFDCQCGSDSCCRRVRGYKFLSVIKGIV